MNRQQSGRLGGRKKAANHRTHVENGKKGAAAKLVAIYRREMATPS